MKKIIITFLTLLCTIFGIVSICLYLNLNKCLRQIDIAENNNKSLLHLKDSLREYNTTLKLSIEQLNYFNDSITRALKKAIQSSKVKEDNIAQLQYLLTSTSRTDTLVFKDTIFTNNVNVDTILTDNKWYSIKLILQSPNTAVVNPSFKNELSTILNYKKETVKPPKKFFLARWFQRKHIITETIIINNNPYTNIDTTRVIEVVKL